MIANGGSRSGEWRRMMIDRRVRCPSASVTSTRRTRGSPPGTGIAGDPGRRRARRRVDVDPAVRFEVPAEAAEVVFGHGCAQRRGGADERAGGEAQPIRRVLAAERVSRRRLGVSEGDDADDVVTL